MTRSKRGKRGRGSRKRGRRAPTDVEEMSTKAFEGLPEYSLSLPTDPRVGFSWKRRVPPVGDPCKWYIGTAVKCDEPGRVGIEWRLIEVSG